MAKKPKKHAAKELTRKQRSRLERERRMEKILLWSVTAVGVVIVGVLAYGFVIEKVVKEREPVAIVNDVPITTAEFQGRVRFTRAQIQRELRNWLSEQQAIDPTNSDMQPYLEYIQGAVRDLQAQLAEENASTLGGQVLDQLIQEELVRQETERRGIVVAPDELQQEIELFFGYDRNPATPTPVPTATPPLTPTEVLTPTPTLTPLPTATPMTEEAFREQYDNYLGQTLKPLGVSEQEYRSWVEVSLLMEELQDQMVAEIPEMVDQVELWLLMAESEEQANEFAARLDAGEDFQTLADELAEDESDVSYGTELDWYPKSLLEDRLGAELADLAFSLEVGERSSPVPNEDGTRYSVIGVVGHETRELDEYFRQQLGSKAYQEWLEAQEVLVERREYQDRVPMDP